MTFYWRFPMSLMFSPLSTSMKSSGGEIVADTKARSRRRVIEYKFLVPSVTSSMPRAYCTSLYLAGRFNLGWGTKALWNDVIWETGPLCTRLPLYSMGAAFTHPPTPLRLMDSAFQSTGRKLFISSLSLPGLLLLCSHPQEALFRQHDMKGH